MQAKKLPNGNLLIPMRAEGPNGEIGDGLVEIGPDHPEWDVWLADANEPPRLPPDVTALAMVQAAADGHDDLADDIFKLAEKL